MAEPTTRTRRTARCQKHAFAPPDSWRPKNAVAYNVTLPAHRHQTCLGRAGLASETAGAGDDPVNASDPSGESPNRARTFNFLSGNLFVSFDADTHNGHIALQYTNWNFDSTGVTWLQACPANPNNEQAYGFGCQNTVLSSALGANLEYAVIGDSNTGGPNGAQDFYSFVITSDEIDLAQFDESKLGADTDEDDDELGEAFPAGAIPNEPGELISPTEPGGDDEGGGEGDGDDDVTDAARSGCGTGSSYILTATEPGQPAPEFQGSPDYSVSIEWNGGPAKNFKSDVSA